MLSKVEAHNQPRELRGLSEVFRGASPTGEAHSPFSTYQVVIFEYFQLT